MQQIERLITASNTDNTENPNSIAREDAKTLRRLTQEFQSELATLRGRVDRLENQVNVLERNQFSVTTKYTAQIVFAAVGVFGKGNATSSDNFGVVGYWRIARKLSLEGWGIYTRAYARGGSRDGDTADIWNWKLSLALPDLFQKGNVEF